VVARQGQAQGGDPNPRRRGRPPCLPSWKGNHGGLPLRTMGRQTTEPPALSLDHTCTSSVGSGSPNAKSGVWEGLPNADLCIGDPSPVSPSGGPGPRKRGTPNESRHPGHNPLICKCLRPCRTIRAIGPAAERPKSALGRMKKCYIICG